MHISTHLTWLFFSFFIIAHFSLSLSDPRISVAGQFCGANRVAPPNPNYIPAFAKSMETLKQLLASDHWGIHVVNTSTPPVYALSQCHQDLSGTDCLLCYATGCVALSRCLPATSGRIYLDGCFFRYDNHSFFDEIESGEPYPDAVNCSSSVGEVEGDEAARSEFKSRVGELIDKVTGIAVSNGGFGVAEVKGVYGLAQCWKTVSSDGCRECLEKAGKEVGGRCGPSREGRGLNAGCYLRYSTEKFFSDGAEENKGSFDGISFS